MLLFGGSIALSTPGARRALLPVTLTAIGVVSGDIGTSPL
jgi:K+ transporter